MERGGLIGLGGGGRGGNIFLEVGERGMGRGIEGG